MIPINCAGEFPETDVRVKEAEPVALIEEILREQDVVIAMPAEDRNAVLSTIAVMLADRLGMDDRVILRSLLDREKLGSTGIGHGVAVPHAQLSNLPEPAAILATLRKPIRFGQPADMPVDVVAALLWPRNKAADFLPVLAGFCRILNSNEFYADLRKATSPSEAHARIVAGWLATAQP